MKKLIIYSTIILMVSCHVDKINPKKQAEENAIADTLSAELDDVLNDATYNVNNEKLEVFSIANDCNADTLFLMVKEYQDFKSSGLLHRPGRGASAEAINKISQKYLIDKRKFAEALWTLKYVAHSD